MKTGFSNLAVLTASVVALASLAGCNFDAGKANFDAVTAEAHKKDSPWDGFTMLVEAKEEGFRQCYYDYCSSSRYEVLRSTEKDMADLYVKSLDMGDPRAYTDLFSDSRQSRSGEELAAFRDDLRQKYVSRLLSFAESAADTSADPKLLYIAGYTITKGQDVVFDYPRAINLLYRAWLAGSQGAAITASAASRQINDPLNAYLWALRCIGKCQRGEPLESFVKGLSPEQIRSAQQAATVRALITVGGSS